jgi:hypothetical protein
MNENKENNLHEELEPHEADTVTSENTELKEDTESGSAVEEDTSKPKSKKKLIGIVIAIIAVIVLAGVGVAYAVGTQPQEETTEAVEVVTEEEPEASVELSVNVTCEGWNEDTSTPIVIAVYEGDVKDTLLSTDENIEVPDPILTTDVEANKDVLIEEITEAGTYTVSIVGSPLLEDGTIFEVPEPMVVTFDEETTTETISMTLTKKAAEDVTEADIAAATAAATTAGADTTKVQNASDATRSSASTAQGGTISQGQTTVQSKPASSTNSGSSTSTSSSSSTNTTNNSSGSSTTQTSQPTHVHNWVYHDAVYKTVHHDAVTTQKSYVVCNVCGAKNIDRNHEYQHAINGGVGGTHVVEESVVVTPAYDEQVLVTAAYYSCSGCGATK